MSSVQGGGEHDETRNDFYGRQLEAAAHKYETELRPLFFSSLLDYVKQGNSAFDSPELQGVYIQEQDNRKQVWCYVIAESEKQSALLKGETV